MLHLFEEIFDDIGDNCRTLTVIIKYWRFLKNIGEQQRTLKNIGEHWRPLKNIGDH